MDGVVHTNDSEACSCADVGDVGRGCEMKVILEQGNMSRDLLRGTFPIVWHFENWDACM